MKKIIKRLIKFRDERNWQKFHTPANLAKSIVLEASELLENFQWEEDNVDIENIKHELADVMAYCLMLSEHYNLDIETILNEKIDLNEKKYPINKAYNSAKKYTEL